MGTIKVERMPRHGQYVVSACGVSVHQSSLAEALRELIQNIYEKHKRLACVSSDHLSATGLASKRELEEFLSL
jgi:hypothetical protein